MTDNDIMRASQMITQVFKNISPEDVENGNRLLGSWRQTVESVARCGAKLAAHTRVVDLKNGVLLVEADHSGWIQLLQLHQNYILTGLRRKNPKLTIGSLAFRLAGSDAHLVDGAALARKERNRMQRRYDAEDALLKESGFDTPQDAERKTEAQPLPPELQHLFDKFKSEILTNQA